MNTRSLATLLSLLFLPQVLLAEVQLELSAGGHDRENCPASCPVPASLKSAKQFTLTRKSDGANIPVQRFGSTQSPRIMWMIHDRLAAGESRFYQLRAVNEADGSVKKANRRVKCKDNGKQFTVTVDQAPVLAFNHATVVSPDGIDSVYRRSGYIHPITTPQGNTVTGDFEPDHPHQHGMFNAFVNTTYQGEPTDFWNQAKDTGDVEFTSAKKWKISGPVFAQFNVTLSHVSINDGKREPAITENLVVRVFDSKPFLFEIVSRQTPATDNPVQVNENAYGGFALRGPSEWLISKQTKSPDDQPTNKSKEDESTDAKNTDPPAIGGFLTSSGRNRDDGNHTRARWVEMHGPIGSQHAGIIALAAESNFRAPQTVRLHPTKPYFCFAPMVLGGFTLKPNDEYVSRFRYVVHDGEPNAKLAERMWQDYAHPPRVKVKVKVKVID